MYFYILADTVFTESHSHPMIKYLADNPCTDRMKKIFKCWAEAQSTWLFKIPHHLVWVKYTYAEIMNVRYFVF